MTSLLLLGVLLGVLRRLGPRVPHLLLLVRMVGLRWGQDFLFLLSLAPDSCLQPALKVH
jgi:hypothetical protein